jgi:hypothetical protein
MNQSEDGAGFHLRDHKDRSIDVSKVAYQFPQPSGMIPRHPSSPELSTSTLTSGNGVPIAGRLVPAAILNVS